jgi:transcriptional regulator NrdR family protein
MKKQFEVASTESRSRLNCNRRRFQFLRRVYNCKHCNYRYTVLSKIKRVNIKIEKKTEYERFRYKSIRTIPKIFMERNTKRV